MSSWCASKVTGHLGVGGGGVRILGAASRSQRLGAGSPIRGRLPSPATATAVASRAAVPPFHVMDLLAAAAAARRAATATCSTWSPGQPSTPAPGPVREAAERALDEQVLGYTVAARHPRAARGHRRPPPRACTASTSTPDDVVVTTGSSGGFLLAFLAAFEAGDRVAIARPGYPCYRNVLTALGCEVVELPTGPESRFQPTVEMLEALDDAGAGPGGRQPGQPDRHDAAARASSPRWRRWCEEHGVQLISDEIYHGIEYASAGACTPRPGRPRARRWCSARSRSTSR